ncbi:FCD domain-containing protein [Bradyrhizobium sp. INPA03-11B]|uniref:GntR family transcriptional regulator n=1 Tax=Bradyrhizobium sp. INPA03-11B TaxID=418598 RepID=UPI00338F14C9
MRREAGFPSTISRANSQTPIREALSLLEAQGLVVNTHLIGYSAAPQLDRRRSAHLYELRLRWNLLPLEGPRSVSTRTPLRLLEAIDKEMRSERQGDARSAYGEFAHSDGVFHDMIALHSGNALIRDHVHLFRLYFHTRATADANKEHSRILPAIRKGDAEAAEQVMRNHIERLRERFIAIFAE